MTFVREDAIRQFRLFIVDEEGMLDTEVVSKFLPEAITAGVVSVWLTGPKSAELEREFDEAIISAEANNAVRYQGATITTARLDDDESIGVHALSDSIPEALGELRSVLIGVFSQTVSVAQSRVTELADAITCKMLESESDRENDSLDD